MIPLLADHSMSRYVEKAEMFARTHSLAMAVSNAEPPPIMAWRAPAPESRKRFALLVGCTAYPNLDPALSLSGPSNDVELTAKLLTETFGYEETEIIKLIQDNEDDMKPYLANIRREFDWLVQSADEEDEVFILLSGHGSQQTDDDPNNPDDFEPDGMDEVFVPADVPRWNSQQPPVGAITDDELRGWLATLHEKKKAFVFFFADTCHSGTLDRGPADDEAGAMGRFLPAAGKPANLNTRLYDQETNRGVSVVKEDQRALDAPHGIASLYAVPPGMLAFERPMPTWPNTSTTKVYGQATWAFNRVMRGLQSKISYQELEDHLVWQFQKLHWMPYPYVSGSNLDREVLGEDSFRSRSRIVLSTTDSGELRLNVGRLHGFRPESRFAVYAAAGARKQNQILGYVKAVEVSAVDSRVIPCPPGENDAPAVVGGKFPEHCSCVPVFINYGDARIDIRVAPFAKSQFDSMSETQRRNLAFVNKVVEDLVSTPNSLVLPANPDIAAAAYVLVGEEHAELRLSGDPYSLTSVRPAYGPFDIDDALQDRLIDAITVIGRANNLRSLAETDQRLRRFTTPFDNGLKYEIRFEKLDGKTHKVSKHVTTTGMKLRSADRVRIEVTNSGSSALDVNILYIESAFRVRSYLPTRNGLATGFDNRVAPGESRSPTITINDSTTGLEDVIVILTESGASRAHFLSLEQDGLKPAPYRSLTSARGSVEANALDLLIDRSLFDVNKERGGNPHSFKNYAIERHSWIVLPQNIK